MKVHSENTSIHPMPASSDVMIRVYAPKIKSWQKPTDQIDTWLDTQGFYRKHIARDESCLFRCVSEQIFLTQVHHLTVRKHCIKFALNEPEIFNELTDTPVKNYVDRLQDSKQCGNTLDMEVISRLYNVDFVVYKEIKKPMEQVTSNGNNSYIMLSLSSENHYDSVYSKQHISNAAVCQSILYEALYKEVFKLEEVDYAVNKMLHDKTARYQPDFNAAVYSTGFQMRYELRDNCRNVKELLDYGITPFPYKVAKSLDPSMYRNVEHDTWNEQKKITRHNKSAWNSKELQEGTKCWVNFKVEGEIVKRVGYIQKMSPNKGPVEVFIPELGEKITVLYESLELIQNSFCVGQSDSIMAMFGKLNNSKENTPQYSMVQENIDDSSSRIGDSYQSEDVSSTSDLHGVQYMHPSSSTATTTCYSCISSHNYPPENDVKSIQHLNPNDELPKYNQTTQHTNENTSVAEQPVPVVQYPMSFYPVMSHQDVEVQPSPYLSNVLPPKPVSNPTEPNDAANPYRVFCNNNNNVDQYYRCGLPTVPYCIISPNYVYPLNPEPPIPVGLPPTTDVRRLQYSPPAAVSQQQNELIYAMPVNTLPNSKAEMPVYPSMITYPNVSMVKKPLARNNYTGDTITTTESSSYRPHKEIVCLKEPPPMTTNVNIPTNIYPYYNNPYSPITPPLLYHSIDYNGACYPAYSDVSPYPENITPPAYHVPHIVPVAYAEDMYQQNNQIICQPIVPASH